MPKIATSGDSVLLPIIFAVAPTFGRNTHKSDGKNIALEGDLAEYNCPKHDNKKEYAIIHASTIHSADGKGIVKVGDKADYCSGSDGVVTSGSSHSEV